ncbi:MAG: beta-propeller fold lactonase family protein [Chloroflexi bacterium]|nr:beta-propeller fold lactonase family protein [Chloroflexota bacterium]
MTHRKVTRMISLILTLVWLILAAPASAAILTFVEAQFDSPIPLNTLNSPQSIAISPDGLHVYVANQFSSTVLVFSRSATTGVLTFVEVERDGVGGVDGLAGAVYVTVSPDGKSVYVAGQSDNAVAVFSRNATTGALTFVEMQKNGVGMVTGISSVIALAVSPDNKHLYTASFLGNSVAVFSRNTTTGALTFVEAKQDNVGGVDGLGGANSVTVSPDNNHVYVPGGADEVVAVFSRNTTTGALTFVETNAPGTGGLTGAISVVVSPDNKHVYVASIGSSTLTAFTRNLSSGRLSFADQETDNVGGVDGLASARAVAISPDGQHLYVASGNDSAVAVFSRNATSGAMTFVEVKKDGLGGVDGLFGASSVVVSPDGQHVYATGGQDNAIPLFSRNATSGALTFSKLENATPDGLAGAISAAVSPDGQHVYIAGQSDNAVAVFSRNATTGKLTFVEVKKDGVGGVDGLNGAASVAVSPDSESVYVSSALDNAVAVFSRNPITGALTFVEFEQDGVGGVDGLNFSQGVTVSPDSNHVYVTGRQDNAVAVFSRNTITGALTFVEVKKDGVGGVDGLGGATGVTVSPDNKHLYVAGSFDDAVAVFSRNTTTGALTFVELKKDGVGGVDDLDNTFGIAVSPDGQQVYAAGALDDALTVFSRSAATGALTFAEAQKDGVGGVDGLDGADAVTISPDNNHVYVAGSNDNAIALFNFSLQRLYLPVVKNN